MKIDVLARFKNEYEGILLWSTRWSWMISHVEVDSKSWSWTKCRFMVREVVFEDLFGGNKCEMCDSGLTWANHWLRCCHQDLVGKISIRKSWFWSSTKNSEPDSYNIGNFKWTGTSALCHKDIITWWTTHEWSCYHDESQLNLDPWSS